MARSLKPTQGICKECKTCQPLSGPGAILVTMRRFLPFAVPALLLVLLASLATLQYRWIGQVSALERQRMEESLRTAAVELSDDFDRELARALAYFHDPRTRDEESAEGSVLDLERWRAEAPYPGLLGEVYRIAPDGSGAPGLSCLRESERRFAPCPWPADLEPLRRRISAHRASGHPLAGLPVDPSLPGLVFSATRRFSSEGPAQALLVVRLDRKVIREELLPALTQRHFGNLGSTVTVIDGEGEVIYRSGPAEGDARSGDVSQPLFVLRPFEELRELHGLHGGRHGRKIRILHAPEGLLMKRRSHEAMGPDAPWQLVVRHRDGSLEAAVARVRHQNLAVSLGIVALLGATIALLLAATQRAQRLARQQLEFVAGVSHELNTPLAAIRSAGQNLADGVVADDPQVRRYGDLVVREGRRLSAMVGQVLEFAGIQAGRRSYRPQPAEVAEIVDGALADCADALTANGVRVETDIPGDLPPVMADPEALRRAVRNLVENAVKYGGSEKWVGVRARLEGREVAVTVEDRGPGIPARERSRIFEPFYRGAHAAVGNIPGSGLGLAIVRHVAAKHGGRVTVESGSGGQGSAFTIRLPAGEELEAAAAPAEVVS